MGALDLPGMGHNQAPVPLDSRVFAASPVEITRLLADAAEPLLRKRDELLAGVARFNDLHPEILDEDVLGEAGDFVKQIAGTVKLAADAFTLAKKPYLEGGRAVDAFFKSITEPLARGMDQVRRPMTEFGLRKEAEERRRRAEAAAAAQAEAARVQREMEEHERRQREAAAAQRPAPVDPPPSIEEAIAAAGHADELQAAANVKAADLTRQRGEFGSVSSLRENWEVEVEDLGKVPLEYLMFDYAKARRDVRKGGRRAIPGCRVFPVKHMQTR